MEEKKPLKRITQAMTHEQREEVKREIEDLTRMMNAGDEGKRGDTGYFHHSTQFIDPDDIKKAVAVKKHRIAQGTPHILKGESANKAFSSAKKLREYIINNMPRDQYVRYPETDEKGNEIDTPQKIHGFNQSVEAVMKWQRLKVGIPGHMKCHPMDLYYHLMSRLDSDYIREDFNRIIRERV